MTGVGGDPASCSRLGGALRLHAASVADHGEKWALLGIPVPASLEATASCLDDAGAALQHYAIELAEVTDGIRRLDVDARAAGLELDGWRVVEPWGPAPAGRAVRRREAAQPLQDRLDRLHSRIGRARAHLLRRCEQVSAALAEESARLRESLGRPDTVLP
jgi:hypothetical protein